ncbi:phage distal tail protein [Amycolatopsis sp. NPDC004772]
MVAEVTQWIDPDGVATTIDVDWKAKGRFMPPVDYQEDVVPDQPGSVPRSFRHGARDFTIRINLNAATEPALRTVQRSMMYTVDPTRGQGTIRVTSPLGDVREIGCRYVAGFETEEEPGVSGPTMQQSDVTFRAFEPYWQDQSDISQTFTIGTPPNFFPFFPVRLTSSEIAVDDTVLNDGDVQTWPVWTITGPGSSISLQNLTTGRSTVLQTASLGIGESITIDTRPSKLYPTGKTILRQNGAPLFEDQSSTSALWPLIKGVNAIRLAMTGAVAGQSALNLSWRRKWLSV